MKITFLGHSGFLVQGKDTKVLIDPFITDNPKAVNKTEELHNDYIVVSHGHSDHMGDAIDLAKKFSSTIIANHEIANYCSDKGCKTHKMHIGGSHTFNSLRVKLTMALHGSSIGKCPAQYLGNPCGILLGLDGTTLYHAGDTGLFGDMALIGRLNKIDIAMLPIGDNFTMGPEDALEAIKLLKPKLVIPMHYNTWEIIAQDPIQFKSKVESQTDTKVIILQPSETLNL